MNKGCIKGLLTVSGNKEGITILEVVFAVYVMGLALISLLGVVQYSVQTQFINKNAVIASMLAQEGLELVRKIRDENFRNDRVWNSGADNSTDIVQADDDNNYAIYADSSDGRPTIIDSADTIDEDAARLYIDSDGYYVNDSSSGNAATNIYRIIEVADSGNGLQVNCTVRFKRPGGGNYDYTASTLLYDWWY